MQSGRTRRTRWARLTGAAAMLVLLLVAGGASAVVLAFDPPPPPSSARRSSVPVARPAPSWSVPRPISRPEPRVKLSLYQEMSDAIRRDPETRWRVLDPVQGVPVGVFEGTGDHRLHVRELMWVRAHDRGDATAARDSLRAPLRLYRRVRLPADTGVLLCGGLEIPGVDVTLAAQWQGTVFLVPRADGTVDPAHVHHELAHLFYREFKTPTFTRDWLRLLPHGFTYDRRVLEQTSSTSKEDHEDGFARARARASMTEDFAVVATLRISRPERCAELRARFPRIGHKVRLAEQFLESVGVELPAKSER